MYSYEYLYYDEVKVKSAVNWVFSAPTFSRQQVCIFFVVYLKENIRKNIDIVNKKEVLLP